MYERLKQIFGEFVTDPEEVNDTSAVPMAATMLFLEVAWADHEITDSELTRIRRSVHTLFKLSEPVLDDIVRRARADHEHEVSLYPFARVLNDALALTDKVELLTELWQLAFTDHIVDKHAEHRIRQIADLLHVPHGDFIAAKLAAKERPGRND